MTDPNFYRQILLARRGELEVLQESAAESRAPVALDQTSVGRLSRIDAMQDQAMALASQRRRRAELAKIGAALRRIDEGEYGYCAVCGEEIAAKRLQVDPVATLCVRCASQAAAR